MIRILLVTAVLVLTGCTTTRLTPAFVFPASSDLSYHAPDGRVWVLHDSKRTGDRTFRISFTPEPTERARWTELLQFEYQQTLPSAEQVALMVAEIKEKDDPGFRWEIMTIESGYIMTHHAPRWKESGITKTIRAPGGATSVSYQSRLDSDPDGRLEFWKKYITELPNGFLKVVDQGKSGSESNVRSSAGNQSH